MGNLTDYFSAASDEVAAAVLDVTSGPLRAAGTRTVAAKGIDPAVDMGMLEELLTGFPYRRLVGNPRWGRMVAFRDEGDTSVVAVTDELRTALAEASEARLREVAVQWDGTFYQSDPSHTAKKVLELAALARGAQTRGERLYCWVCL